MTKEELLERIKLRRRTAAQLLGEPTLKLLTLRYMEREIMPAVYWSNKPGELLAYVNVPTNAGLRLVGRVEAEAGRNRHSSRQVFSDQPTCGWFTDPDGFFHPKDGDGLVWGVVYQLPARKRVMRLVAGYQFGGFDDGPTIDFGTIFTGVAEASSRICDTETAHEAAKHADSMAEEVAEAEREYRLEQREEENE